MILQLAPPSPYRTNRCGARQTPQLPKLREVNTVYAGGTIPKATYKLPADVPTIVVPNHLLVRNDFRENDACALSTLIWTKKDELAKVHPAARELDAKIATQTDPVPLAPGSKTAFDKIG